MSDKPLDQIVPVEQRTIDFYDDHLVAVRDTVGVVWVPVRPICGVLDVSWPSQLNRIRRDPVMSEALRGVFITNTPERGGTQEMACLPLKFVRFWLAGINASRVRPEIRDKLIQYQREVIEIIDRAFARAAPPTPPDVDEARMVALRDLALQQADLMRQQAQLWDAMIAERRRLTSVQQLAEEHEGMIRDLSREMDQVRHELAQVQVEVARLQQMESGQLRLLLPSGEAKIRSEQQATIQELVRDLVAAADAHGIRLWQNRGGNNYQSVYAELKTTFRVPSYKELTQAQYSKAVEWLQSEIARIEER